MHTKRSIFVIVFMLLLPWCSWSQTACKDALYEADKLYESGKLRECIDRLEPCLKLIKDKEEKLESYHLLAMAYQALNETDKTNYYIRKFLVLKPDYQKYPNIDPLDFSRMVNQYSVSPSLYLGVKAALNMTSVGVKKSYTLFPSVQSYSPRAGLQFGITGTYVAAKNILVNADVSYSRYSIRHIIDTAGSAKQVYSEQQNYGAINLSLRKLYTFKKINFFIGLGGGSGYLMSANISLESIDIFTGSSQQASKNPIKERNKLQPWLLFAAGIDYPMSQGLLTFECNFTHFLNTTVNSSNRYSDTNFIFNNQYINDDISLRATILNVSYSLPVKWKVQLRKS